MALSYSSNEQFTHLDQLQCDEFEKSLLPLIRSFVQSISEEHPRSWHYAFSVSKERWGPQIGLPMAFSLSNAIFALFSTRETGIETIDHMDTKLRDHATADEQAFLLLIHNMRRDNTGKARKYVSLLTGGRMDSNFIQSMLLFCRQNGLSIPKIRPSTPHLRLIKN